MHFGDLQYRPSSDPRQGERGYMLIVVIFIMVALIIGMYAMTANIKEQIQRDQEEEMIHRGVQYARAVRRYYKKFGRFPATIEALEDSNHVRFLRKRYKDPLVPEGQWAIVRYGQVQFGTGGLGPGFSGQTGLPNVPGVTSMFQNQPAAGQTQTPPQQPTDQQQPTDASGQPTNQPNPNDTVGGSSGSSFGTSTTSTNNTLGAIGGGAIIGVASTSPKQSLRIVADKNHYKDWRFIYDPFFDRGAPITGPYDPKKALGQYATGMQASQGIGTPVGETPGQQTQGSPGFNPAAGGGGIQPQPQPPDQNAPPN
jgi:hypothetical protein